MEPQILQMETQNPEVEELQNRIRQLELIANQKDEAFKQALNQKDEIIRTLKELVKDSVSYSSEEIDDFNQWFVRGLECLEKMDEHGLIDFLQNNADSVPIVQEFAETYSRVVGKPYRNIDNEKGKLFEKLRHRFKIQVSTPGPNITYSKTEMEATVLGSTLEIFREELQLLY